MADIFISYAREDRDKARDLARALEERSWTVWWDREIAIGRSFDEVIEGELRACKCAVVLWTPRSVASRWVRGEARSAARREVLVPILAESVDPPLEFADLQTADLTNWVRFANHPEFEKVLRRIEELAPHAGGVEPPRPSSRRLETRPQARTQPAVPHRSRRLSAAIVVALLIVVGAAYLWRTRWIGTPSTAVQPSAESKGSDVRGADVPPPAVAKTPASDSAGKGTVSPQARRVNTPGFQLTINHADYFVTKEFEIPGLDLNRDFQIEFAVKSERAGGSTRYGIAWNFQPDDYLLFTLHSTDFGYYSIGAGRSRSYAPFSRFSQGRIAINGERDFDVLRMSRSGDNLIFAVNGLELWKTRDYRLLSNRFAFWAGDFSDAVMGWYTTQP
ncbi:MAG TPA: toll/interleukin-1 receptor domain-containing protein [Vicinamibacterales bacterium]|nr:toll/interleukin-1 receptor domain-containing protein [Vicinamibacterales bacterium]